MQRGSRTEWSRREIRWMKKMGIEVVWKKKNNGIEREEARERTEMKGRKGEVTGGKRPYMERIEMIGYKDDRRREALRSRRENMEITRMFKDEKRESGGNLDTKQ